MVYLVPRWCVVIGCWSCACYLPRYLLLAIITIVMDWATIIDNVDHTPIGYINLTMDMMGWEGLRDWLGEREVAGANRIIADLTHEGHLGCHKAPSLLMSPWISKAVDMGLGQHMTYTYQDVRDSITYLHYGSLPTCTQVTTCIQHPCRYLHASPTI